MLITATSSGVLRSLLAAIILLPLCLGFNFVVDALWVRLMPDELTNASMVQAGRDRIATEKQAKIIKQTL